MIVLFFEFLCIKYLYFKKINNIFQFSLQKYNKNKPKWIQFQSFRSINLIQIP